MIDKDVLEFIKTELAFSGPIIEDQANDKPRYSLRVSSRKLCEDLNKWGVVPRKSATIEFPTFLEKELIPHFICGLFDSDGYVHIPTTLAKWKTSRKFGFSGTISVITGVKQFFEKELNFSESKIKLEKSTTNNFATLHYVCSKVERFYKEIYNKSAYRLQRKEQKFKDNEIVYAQAKA